MPSLPAPYYDAAGIQIYHADARDILPLLAPSSVDMILTDPPYHLEFIWAYELVAREGARITKTGAFIETYAGSQHLPEYLRVMSPHLTWFWLLNLQHTGAEPRFWTKRLWVASKPILAWTNGPVTPTALKWTRSDRADIHTKKYHAWGQGPVWARTEIQARTQPGDLILDAFMGAGNVLLAAKELHRRAIGIEIEEKYCVLAVERLAQMPLPMLETVPTEQMALEV